MITKHEIEEVLRKKLTFDNVSERMYVLCDHGEVDAGQLALAMAVVRKLMRQAIDDLPTTYSCDISDDVLDAKRLYVDLSNIVLPCPKCGKDRTFNDEYLSEGDMRLHFWCPDSDEYEDEDGCGHEWKVSPKDVSAYLVVTL